MKRLRIILVLLVLVFLGYQGSIGYKQYQDKVERKEAYLSACAELEEVIITTRENTPIDSFVNEKDKRIMSTLAGWPYVFVNLYNLAYTPEEVARQNYGSAEQIEELEDLESMNFLEKLMPNTEQYSTIEVIILTALFSAILNCLVVVVRKINQGSLENKDIEETEATEFPIIMDYKAYISEYELNIDLENTTILIKVPSSTKVIVVEED